jgi:ATP-binding cassette, subfamily B, bacterial HlyB/CyaB
MRKGEIVEVGSHEELLRREGGLYAHLCSLQSDQARAPA